MKFFLTPLGILFLLVSCNMQTPENYFDRTTLNTNKLVQFGSEDLIRYAELQNSGNLFMMKEGEMEKTDKIEAYISTYVIPDLEHNIGQIENLRPTDDTKVMIEKSIHLFNYAKATYQKEYLTIAKMIDNGEKVDTINSALAELDSLKGKEFFVLFDDLWEVAMPYAKANGIEVKTY